MSATAARAMTHLHCQQPSCSALTALHRDSAQSACLSARPSVCLSVRHTPVLCRYPSIARQHGRILIAAAAHCRQPPRQILSKFPKNSPKNLDLA